MGEGESWLEGLIRGISPEVVASPLLDVLDRRLCLHLPLLHEVRSHHGDAPRHAVAAEEGGIE